MLQSIFTAVNTLLIAVLLYCIVKLSEEQSDYADKQSKQGWRIWDLEQEKYAVRGRLNDLEWEVRKDNADNDNAGD